MSSLVIVFDENIFIYHRWHQCLHTFLRVISGRKTESMRDLYLCYPAILTNTLVPQLGLSSILQNQLGVALDALYRHRWAWKLARHCSRPFHDKRPQQRWRSFTTWYSSGALVLIFNPFGHSMTKGENFELVLKRVCLYGCFLLSYNSRSSETLLDRVVNLNPMVLWYFWCVFCVLIPHIC